MRAGPAGYPIITAREAREERELHHKIGLAGWWGFSCSAVVSPSCRKESGGYSEDHITKLGENYGPTLLVFEFFVGEHFDNYSHPLPQPRFAGEGGTDQKKRGGIEGGAACCKEEEEEEDGGGVS